MSIKVKRLKGRPSFFQLMLEAALTGVANDLIDWQKSNSRVATGKSQDWLITLKRVGSNKPKDIIANLIGVGYIYYALFGRGKGPRPEWQDILAWMRVRGISGRDVGSGRFRTRLQAAKAIAVRIGEIGTTSVSIGTTMLDLFYTRNLKLATDRFTPQITAETEQQLIDQFVEGTKNLKNIQVTTK